MKDNYSIIMAGGVGSRFWPASTSQNPKQFLDILGIGKSLIQLTFERIKKVCPAENIIVVTTEQYKDLVKEHLPEIEDSNILAEPCRRNTAPCVAYGCYKIFSKNNNAKILVAPSDHLIINETEYIEVIKKSFIAAQEDILITLGITPNRPETGYGYIKSTIQKHKDYDFLNKVEAFTEKPNKEKAKVFYEQDDYFWNSGMFIWSAKAIINSFKENCIELHELFNIGLDKYNTPNELNFIQNTYKKAKSISVDYAILEHAENIFVYPCDIGWTDLGTWGSLHQISDKSNDENACIGEKIITQDCKNSLISNQSSKLMVVQGLNDFIVVNTNDALLICNKQEEQSIKGIVEEISKDKILKKFI